MRSLGLIRGNGSHWTVQLDQVQYNRRGVPNLEAHLGHRLATQVGGYTDGTLVVATSQQRDPVLRVLRKAKRELTELWDEGPHEGEVFWVTMAVIPIRTSDGSE